LFPFWTTSYFGTPSRPGALSIAPVTTLNPAAWYGHNTLSSNNTP
jgi:hypothetical protein